MTVAECGWVHGGVVVARKATFVLDEVLAHFDELEDPRSSVNLRHPLPSVIVVALLAVLSGADGPTAIHVCAELLLKCLPLPHGIPSKDVFRRVLMAVDPFAFQQCFTAWLVELKRASAGEAEHKSEKPGLAIDGKTLRRSFDRSNGLGAMHLVSVWMTQAGMTLAQVATEAKSNEITAIPELLKLIDCAGAIMTIDAMGTQTAIAEQITAAGADYVLPVKGNQAGLQQAVVEFIDEHVNNDFRGTDARRHVVKEKSHGRLDRRVYWQFPVPVDLATRDRWAGLKTIGVVMYESLCGDGRHTTEIRYFISSLPMGVKQFARGAVRSHWQIETTCHWSLDLTYREDELRTRERRLVENLAWLRRFTLSLLKQHPGKQSLIMKRRMCGWNEDFLPQVLLSQTT
ncbi:MAG: ISAs1 family transposase [Planctomycetaceae bacterium]